MQIKKRIVKVDIPEYGEFYVTPMTRALQRANKAVLKGTTEENKGEALEQVTIATILACIVNADGTPAFSSADELDDLGLDLINELSNKILEVSSGIAPKGDPEKNSETIPNSSSHSN